MKKTLTTKAGLKFQFVSSEDGEVGYIRLENKEGVYVGYIDRDEKVIIKALTEFCKKSNTLMKRKQRKKSRIPTFMKPVFLSPALEKVVNCKRATKVDIVKALWLFVKQNDLQDKAERRKIHVGNHPYTKALFGKQTVSMFEMNRILNKHVSPKPFKK